MSKNEKKYVNSIESTELDIIVSGQQEERRKASSFVLIFLVIVNLIVLLDLGNKSTCIMLIKVN